MVKDKLFLEIEMIMEIQHGKEGREMLELDVYAVNGHQRMLQKMELQTE